MADGPKNSSPMHYAPYCAIYPRPPVSARLIDAIEDQQGAQECDRCAHDPPNRLPDLTELPQNGQCIFGWGKQHGTMRKTRYRGIATIAADFMLNAQSHRLQSRAHSQAHRRPRRSLPASRQNASDRPKNGNGPGTANFQQLLNSGERGITRKPERGRTDLV